MRNWAKNLSKVGEVVVCLRPGMSDMRKWGGLGGQLAWRKSTTIQRWYTKRATGVSSLRNGLIERPDSIGVGMVGGWRWRMARRGAVSQSRDRD